VLKYGDLIAEPAVAVTKTVKALGFDLQSRPEAIIPRFTELNQIDEGFFRRGINGSYLDEMSDELHDRFWSVPDNAAAMALVSGPVGSRAAERDAAAGP